MTVLTCLAKGGSASAGIQDVSCLALKALASPLLLHLGVFENRGPEYSTLNSRILIMRTPI